MVVEIIIVRQNVKIHTTKSKMVSIQIPELFCRFFCLFGFFFASLKVLAVESSDGRAFRDTAEKEELINLMLTMH